MLPTLNAQEVPEVNEPPHALSTVSIPSVDGLDEFISNQEAAVRLGKALFWDMSVGSDGNSCASCHFHAGVDNRVKNQLSPGLLNVDHNYNPAPDVVFDPTASGGQGGPNYTLVADDFPFIQFNDMNNASSGVTFQTGDTSSSQGVFNQNFVSIHAQNPVNDECTPLGDNIFHVGGIQTRKVEPRNTPSMINAVFNFRNFWDGRANNVFNGVDPFGKRNDNAFIVDSSGVQHQIDLRNSSLASQAVGPPLSTLEMSCGNRLFADIGQKLLPRNALQFQEVHADDSVLGSLRGSNGVGLTQNYKQLVDQAFAAKWRSDTGQTFGPNGEYNLMERNFSLFFGLALQAYQSTLVSDDAPYDRFASLYHGGDHVGADQQISASARRGLDIFLDKGKCINCHSGPEFSGAASELSSDTSNETLVERMLMGDGNPALYDSGFYNIGVTPTREDLGVGANDPFGNPLSFSKQFRNQDFVDPISVDTCKFEVPFESQSTSMTVRDQFNATSYSNNNGSSSWNGSWTEAYDNNSPSSGRVRIRSGKLRLRSNGRSATRKVDLTDSTSATLTFDWATSSRVDWSDRAIIEISSDAGASWTVLEQITGLRGAHSGSNSYDIAEHISADTAIRFRMYKYGGWREYFYVDNVEIAYSGVSDCSILPADLPQARLAVKGAFKTPILRNVELTGPYMHNGSLATLEQVVQFYNRGGNFGTSSSLPENPELDPDIRQLGLSDQEQADLVEFLKTLTDERVAMEQAPFDRPQLIIPNGHPGDENQTETDDGILAKAFFEVQGGVVVPAAAAIELPPVGANGRWVEGLDRLASFADVLEPGGPSDVLSVAAADAMLSGAFALYNGSYAMVDNSYGSYWNFYSNISSRVDFTFTVTQPGFYFVEGDVLSPSSGEDSFWVQVDGGPAGSYLWDTGRHYSFTPTRVRNRGEYNDVQVWLDAGTHVVTLYLREDGTAVRGLALIPTF